MLTENSRCVNGVSSSAKANYLVFKYKSILKNRRYETRRNRHRNRLQLTANSSVVN